MGRLMDESEAQLKERLEKRKTPLRDKTYDEQKRIKSKAAGRRRARCDMKIANEDHVEPDTKETSIGDVTNDSR